MFCLVTVLHLCTVKCITHFEIEWRNHLMPLSTTEKTQLTWLNHQLGSKPHNSILPPSQISISWQEKKVFSEETIESATEMTKCRICLEVASDNPYEDQSWWKILQPVASKNGMSEELMWSRYLKKNVPSRFAHCNGHWVNEESSDWFSVQ